MAETIRALQRETVDQICRRVYGDETGYVEAVLAANPGLAGRGLFLPMGTVVILPDVQRFEEGASVVTLWN